MMKLVRTIGLLVLLCMGFSAFAQAPNEAARQRAEKLRAELRELAGKETEAQARQKMIEIELKPENIQRSINHIPSLNPDELREKRRLYLESEMTKVRLELEQLATDKTKLEAAINEAEAEAQRPPEVKAAPEPGEEKPAEATKEAEPPAKPAPQPAKKTRSRKARGKQ